MTDVVLRILQVGLQFAIIFPAIVLHEVAHGYAAYLLGDNTAKHAGRLTLNPIKHIDLWGTILLPLFILFISGGSFFFGYAKPVPFNPHNFKDKPLGTLITGIAGPVTNLALAVVMGLMLRMLPEPAMFAPGSILAGLSAGSIIMQVLLYFVWGNLVLAFFNLVPIPPLDGSRVLQYFLPETWRRAYFSIEPYGFFIIIAVSWFLPIFSYYLIYTVVPIFTWLTGVQGF